MGKCDRTKESELLNVADWGKLQDLFKFRFLYGRPSMFGDKDALALRWMEGTFCVRVLRLAAGDYSQPCMSTVRFFNIKHFFSWLCVVSYHTWSDYSAEQTQRVLYRFLSLWSSLSENFFLSSILHECLALASSTQGACCVLSRLLLHLPQPGKISSVSSMDHYRISLIVPHLIGIVVLYRLISIVLKTAISQILFLFYFIVSGVRKTSRPHYCILVRRKALICILY